MPPDPRRYETGPDATIRATDEALGRSATAQSVVFVEGISDQIAVESLARRMARDLDREGVVVVPIGGAHAVANVASRFADRPEVRLSGLVDEAEAELFHRAAASAPALAHDRIQVCDADLEDELIRALEPADLEALLDAEGDLGAFTTMRKQAAWNGQPFERQLHRWLRSISGRTNRYADLILATADDERLPPPLVRLVEQI